MFSFMNTRVLFKEILWSRIWKQHDEKSKPRAWEFSKHDIQQLECSDKSEMVSIFTLYDCINSIIKTKNYPA
jgi:hypothetical protein